MPALEAGQGQSSVAVRLNLGVDVASHVEQELHCGRVPVHRGEHQRGDAELAASPGVDLGTVRQQELDDVGVASRGGEGEGGVVGDIAVLLVGAAG